MQRPSFFELKRDNGQVIGQAVLWEDGAATLRLIHEGKFTEVDVINFEEVEVLFDLYRYTDARPKFL